MPGKYVPPQLRNKDGNMNSGNSENKSYSGTNTRSSNFNNSQGQQSNSNPFNRGYNRNRNSYNRGYNNNNNNSGNYNNFNRSSGGGGYNRRFENAYSSSNNNSGDNNNYNNYNSNSNFYGNNSSYNRSGGGSYNNNYNGYNNGPKNYSFNSQRYDNGPPRVVSYIEQQKAKGINVNTDDNNNVNNNGENTNNSNKNNNNNAKPSGRFASWDSRSSNSGGLTPLGFHGSTIESDKEITSLFASTNSTGINFDKYDDIPVETSGTEIPPPIDSFTSEEAKKLLPKQLSRNLELSGFKKPTPVQKYSIPIGLANRDLMACAQTGSGKTGGFLFPIISVLLRKGALVPEFSNRGGSRYRVAYPNAAVLGPTRELVVQIYEEAQKFCYATGIKPVVVYGGANSQNQRRELQMGCDLLVGTPGRLLDFLERGDVALCCVQHMVLDEADRMLDMGFEPSIRRIVHEMDMPRTGESRTFMFSATFPREIQQLAADFMDDYIFLTVGRVGSAAKDITQTLERVEEHSKRDVLMSVLNAIEGGLVLVFVQTKRSAESLQHFLYTQGFPTASIHGDRSQFEREQALQAFKTGQTPILVATDVAARGLDIDNVTFVINFDLPGNIDDYVHRIGRTGRAGKKGTALSFFTDKNANIASQLLELLEENNQEVPNWLRSYSQGGFRRGGYGRGRNNNTRDYRSNYRPNRSSAANTHNNSGGGGNFNRQGGGGGGRKYNGGGRSNTNSNAGGSGVTDAW